MTGSYVAWAAAAPYAAALRTGRGPLFLRRTDGRLLPLEMERWCARADAVAAAVPDRCEGAVLDADCGPGRLVAELAARGRAVLGVDVGEAAVDHTVGLGGQARRRSVFEPLPGEGRWDTVLLMDGDIVIGVEPSVLLERVATLLRPGGLLIAETVPGRVDARAGSRWSTRSARPGPPVPRFPGRASAPRPCCGTRAGPGGGPSLSGRRAAAASPPCAPRTPAPPSAVPSRRRVRP
ncbi:class I SAM-dependent methyltransferase [Streptomyces camelliae]|uniref:Methyltransferase domain-containing protein n=1 Tax=Streptomyces camelliae TaxID=3004093 RepID=A0ABY7PCQ5_9ACTN|nr:methyltransferase domain-containing protein [Streptomyces sp. HUAS 2-6]WBO68375.1 methyltransferase domain-containing protein [Streptomyces sp. HUAS 2-6]